MIVTKVSKADCAIEYFDWPNPICVGKTRKNRSYPIQHLRLFTSSQRMYAAHFANRNSCCPPLVIKINRLKYSNARSNKFEQCECTNFSMGSLARGSFIGNIGRRALHHLHGERAGRCRSSPPGVNPSTYSGMGRQRTRRARAGEESCSNPSAAWHRFLVRIGVEWSSNSER
jgi:hypothetical protein